MWGEMSQHLYMVIRSSIGDVLTLGIPAAVTSIELSSLYTHVHTERLVGTLGQLLLNSLIGCLRRPTHSCMSILIFALMPTYIKSSGGCQEPPPRLPRPPLKGVPAIGVRAMGM